MGSVGVGGVRRRAYEGRTRARGRRMAEGAGRRRASPRPHTCLPAHPASDAPKWASPCSCGGSSRLPAPTATATTALVEPPPPRPVDPRPPPLPPPSLPSSKASLPSSLPSSSSFSSSSSSSPSSSSSSSPSPPAPARPPASAGSWMSSTRMPHSRRISRYDFLSTAGLVASTSTASSGSPSSSMTARVRLCKRASGYLSRDHTEARATAKHRAEARGALGARQIPVPVPMARPTKRHARVSRAHCRRDDGATAPTPPGVAAAAQLIDVCRTVHHPPRP